ncbi:MAG: hypothetical protein NW214_10965 [Pseudanabaenaceae cyanobacterium bins.39]|nr:hypothetical protein [Pseudanabaenaceae cyanobacterium bins.39]
MTHSISCNHCGSKGKAIFKCSSRELGHCPFIRLDKVKKVFSFRELNPENYVLSLLILLGVISLNFYLLSVWNTLPWISIWSTSLGLLVVIVVIAVILTEEVRLYNPETGVRLEISRFIGIDVSYKWSSRGKALPIHFKLNQDFSLPPSVLGIAAISSNFDTKFQTDLRISMKKAVTIVRFALIALIANENIEVYRYENNYSQDRYYFVVGQNDILVQGNVEKELFRIVQLWQNRSIMESWSWTDGSTIYDLISSVFRQPHKWLQPDQGSYKKWLIENVYLNVITLELGKIEAPSLFGFQIAQDLMRLEWNNVQTIQIQREIQIIDDLSKQLAMIDQDFYQELDKKILIAIKDREPKGDN